MKLKHGDILLLIVYGIGHVTARHLGHISNPLQQLSHSNRHPLIVFVKTNTQLENVEDSREYEAPHIIGDYDLSEEDEAKEEAKYLLYDYLLRTNYPTNSEEAIDDKKRTALREALRAKCKARVKCEKKCNKKTKNRKNCPANCKAVFDELDLCDPPKEKKKKKCEEEDDKCPKKRGKTMPPKWF